MMAAERTPSRRKQCVFRRTFQRFPFGKCERRSRSSSSSYDVHPAEGSTSQNSEKWSPTDPAISTFNVNGAGHRESAEREANDKTQPTNGIIFNGGYEDSVVLEPVSSLHHVSSLPLSPHVPLSHHHTDAMQIYPDMEQPDTDSAYSSVSYREEQPRHAVSPPSPSISSMEMDVGVDPETGERAME